MLGGLLFATLGCEGLGDVSIGADRRDAAAEDGTAPLDGGALSPALDGGASPSRSCGATPDCVGACPSTSLGCVCGLTPMGARCVPSCRTNPDCPPGPMGVMHFCRMGACLP
jgi:hypothetical protein